MLEFRYFTFRVNEYWHAKVFNGVVRIPENVFPIDLPEKHWNTLKNVDIFSSYIKFFPC